MATYSYRFVKTSSIVHVLLPGDTLFSNANSYKSYRRRLIIFRGKNMFVSKFCKANKTCIYYSPYLDILTRTLHLVKGQSRR